MSVVIGELTGFSLYMTFHRVRQIRNQRNKNTHALHCLFLQTMGLQTSMATVLEKAEDTNHFTTGYVFTNIKT